MAAASADDNNSSCGSKFADLWGDVAHELLSTLEEAFPECKSTKYCKSLFEKYVLQFHKKTCAEKWHEVMHKYTEFLLNPNKGPDEKMQTIFMELNHNGSSGSGDSPAEATTAKKYDGLEDHSGLGLVSRLVSMLLMGSSLSKGKAYDAISDPAILLRVLNFEEKWANPGLDVNSKRNLVQYFVRLNGYALFHAKVPAEASGELYEWMHSKDPEHARKMITLLLPKIIELPPPDDKEEEQQQQQKLTAADYLLAMSCIKYNPNDDDGGGGIGAERHHDGNDGDSPPPSDGRQQQLSDILKFDDNTVDTIMGFCEKNQIKGIERGLISKMGNVVKALPQDTVQQLGASLMSGDMSALMNPSLLSPDLLKTVAESLEHEQVNLAEVFANIDIQSVMSSLGNSEEFANNPMLQSMTSAMLAAGGGGQGGGLPNIASLIGGFPPPGGSFAGASSYEFE